MRDVGGWHSAIPSSVIRCVVHIHGETSHKAVPRQARLERIRTESDIWAQGKDEWLVFPGKVQSSRTVGSRPSCAPLTDRVGDDSACAILGDQIRVRRIGVIRDLDNFKRGIIHRLGMSGGDPRAGDSILAVGTRVGDQHERVCHGLAKADADPAMRHRARHVEVDVAIGDHVEPEDEQAVERGVLKVEVRRLGIVIDAAVSIAAAIGLVAGTYAKSIWTRLEAGREMLASDASEKQEKDRQARGSHLASRLCGPRSVRNSRRTLPSVMPQEQTVEEGLR